MQDNTGQNKMGISKSRGWLKAVSLFASAGIAEYYLGEIGVEVVLANELLRERADLYQATYPSSTMICGDIRDPKIYNDLLRLSPDDLDILIASPPCQGVSVAGKNRCGTSKTKDERNYLILSVIDFIKVTTPKYVLIENVPEYLQLRLDINGTQMSILELLKVYFASHYEIDGRVFDSQDYGVPQRRKRSFIRMWKRGFRWLLPHPQTPITVREAIGYLPSLESSERSNIPWHFARKHTAQHIECMRHTPTGASALDNEIYYPKKRDGSRISAYRTTYRRMEWDAPAPTITMRNDAISSQLNVHPGRKLPDGTYSDARVLTPLELMLLNSLPENWAIPRDTNEKLIRECIGESIPPLLIKEVLSGIE